MRLVISVVDNVKKVFVILFVLIIFAGCLTCNQLNENDPNNSEMIKEYYLREAPIQNCEHFQGKLMSGVKIESLDGVCCYYYYKGLIAPNMDGKFTLDSIEYVPGNKEYFVKNTSNCKASDYAYPLYLSDLATIRFLSNNTYKSKAEMPAFEFEVVIVSNIDRTKDSYYFAGNNFDDEMKMCSFIINFNNKEETLVLTKDEIEQITFEDLKAYPLLEEMFDKGYGCTFSLDYLK